MSKGVLHKMRQECTFALLITLKRSGPWREGLLAFMRSRKGRISLIEVMRPCIGMQRLVKGITEWLNFVMKLLSKACTQRH